MVFTLVGLVVASLGLVGRLELRLSRAQADLTQARLLAEGAIQAVLPALAAAGRESFFAYTQLSLPAPAEANGGTTVSPTNKPVLTPASLGLELGGDFTVTVEDEAGKLDLNRVTREMLLALPGMDESLAAAILARRAEGSFRSVEDLLALEGVTPSFYAGEDRNHNGRLDPGEDANANGVLDLGLRDLFTVESAEEETLPGGKAKLNLNQTDAAGLRQAFPFLQPAEAQAIVQYRAQHGPFTARGDLLRVPGLDRDTVAAMIDGVTIQTGPTAAGRVNLNTAPLPVLQALPGLGGGLAEEIALRREERPFRSLAEFFRLPGIPATTLIAVSEWVTVTSQRFTLWAVGEAGMSRAGIQALWTPMREDKAESTGTGNGRGRFLRWRDYAPTRGEKP